MPPGSLPPPSLTRRVGTTLGGRYRLVRLLGHGGMGAVFEAENTWTERRVAVKLLLDAARDDEEVAARFRREARAATKIGHPNIVDVLDMGQDTDGTLFLVTELLAGEDLRSLLARRVRLEAREALEILVPVMGALVAAHRAGIVHRDLKPENLFLARTTTGLTPTVIDFGISKSVGGDGSSLTVTGTALGTPFYMSPEQARGERGVDAQTDVWAMGVVFYEVLTGFCPFLAENYNALMIAILTEEPKPVHVVVPGLARELSDVLARALAKDRARRFATMREFLSAVLECPVYERETWFRTLAESQRTSLALADTAAVPASDPGLAMAATATTTEPASGSASAFGRTTTGRANWVRDTGSTGTPRARRALLAAAVVLFAGGGAALMYVLTHREAGAARAAVGAAAAPSTVPAATPAVAATPIPAVPIATSPSSEAPPSPVPAMPIAAASAVATSDVPVVARTDVAVVAPSGPAATVHRSPPATRRVVPGASQRGAPIDEYTP